MIRIACAGLLLLSGCIQTVERDLGGPNARNMGAPGRGLIVMSPDVSDYAAVWAQEYYEVQTKVTPTGARRYTTDPAFRREVELMGHEIEVQVAVRYYGAEEGPRRASEARGLALYEDFRGTRPRAIAREMRRRTDAALAWIAANRTEIEGRLR